MLKTQENLNLKMPIPSTFQKQLENVDYCKYMGSLVTNQAKYTRGNKFIFAMAKSAFRKKILFASKLDLNLRKKVVKCYICRIAFYDVENKTPLDIDQKYIGSS